MNCERQQASRLQLVLKRASVAGEASRSGLAVTIDRAQGMRAVVVARRRLGSVDGGRRSAEMPAAADAEVLLADELIGAASTAPPPHIFHVRAAASGILDPQVADPGDVVVGEQGGLLESVVGHDPTRAGVDLHGVGAVD